jgi:cystathionine gamma-synthase
VVPDDAYGGTYRLFSRVLERWGVAHTPVSLADLDAVRAAMRPETSLIWCETPTNPLLGIADIAGLAQIAAGRRRALAVDNTFASPYLQQPLALGADVVVHSTTKYLGGHSDVVGGALVTTDATLGEELAYHQNAMGGVPGAFDSWLVLRGRQDARRADGPALRERRAGRRAADRPPRVAVVLYPGLPEHPGHDIAAKQMSGFGGMVSFRLAGGERPALDVCRATKVFILAESLGGVESLIEHPGPDDARQRGRLAARGPVRPGPAVGRASRAPTTCWPTSSRALGSV